MKRWGLDTSQVSIFRYVAHSQLDRPTQQTIRSSCSILKYFHFDLKQKVKILAKTLLHLIIALFFDFFDFLTFLVY